MASAAPVDGAAPTAAAAPLAAYSLFAAMLAAAGLPIYIHAPKVYSEQYGIGLGLLGAVLFGLRLFDLVQDPALGWVVARLGRWRGPVVAGSAAVMALAMLGLFAVAPPIWPVVWFALTLALMFTAYSFLNIAFYARGVERARGMGAAGHLRLAGWREAGALLGVSLAAMAPSLLAPVSAAPYAIFAGAFILVTAAAVWAMRREWAGDAVPSPMGFGAVLRDPTALRLLVLAAVNAAPLAVTATLFLFFVESRLGAAAWEGPLLILFFLSAAAAAPFWAGAATRFGARPVLLTAMVLSIIAFICAYLLGTGDTAAFAAICVASGAMLGADTVILPALFARRMAAIAPEAGQGFGLWSFASKFTLAFAAVILLPLLDASGFVSGGANGEPALRMLSVLYALVPCALKLVAIALLLATPLAED
jgi:glycoside/pentoside/hexuronide:cation symporter, GPH family